MSNEDEKYVTPEGIKDKMHEDAITSISGMTVSDLDTVLRVARENGMTDDSRVIIGLVDRNVFFKSLDEVIVAGVALDPATGNLVFAIYPGSLHEFQTGIPDKGFSVLNANDNDKPKAWGRGTVHD